MQRFWGVCGAVGPLEVRADDGSGAGEIRRVVRTPFVVIGRDPKADIVLDHDAISRRHAYLQVVAGRIFWVDLGSRAGVAQDGVVAPMGWLGRGEAIDLGPFRVVVDVLGTTGDDPDGRPNPMTDRGPASWPDAALEFPNHPGGAARWRIGRILTLVGRSTDCRLRIDDDGVSRFHCALVRTPEGPWAVDLLSREGIRLEGARARIARLDPGASLHVGRYRMIVRPADPPRPCSNDDAPASLPRLPRDQLPEVARRRRPPAPVIDRPVVELPGMAGRPGDLEAYLGRLEQMQLQMFEQFHEAMMTMFRTFGAMQRDQMDRVGEELDRIRELGLELRSLQSGDRPAGPPPPGPGPSPGAPPSAPREGDTRSPSSPSPPDPTGGAAGRDLHDAICQRIARLEAERQSRWRRIIDLISGGAGP
ncbi:FHA domain-containing protein [Tautonia plasticadhaerens]|uniref:FHA domain protein n=1 Tax=Tautonia plasticadhaerens TaxID=2527974 RepID=A0A518HFS7_9BACT|nr:FHA domain-containing protein [Tautonia plasticadhaerens]QDV39691.1 FHA domain protein [Tautonia plasticadhaerens]